MPLRKKIPILKDLCFDNIIRNIVFHGEMFMRHRDRENGEICGSYKTLQFLFTDDLLQRLFVLLLRETEDENLRVLQDVMFECEKKPECDRYWPCLEIFFNEHTSVILPHLRVVLKYHLTDVTKVKDIFRCFMRDRLYDAIPRFRNLREVKLAYPGDGEAFKKIMETCPLIKYLSAEIYDTDLLFLSLCKHHSFQEEFIFCPENGECSKAGKHLEHLHVKLNGTTMNGAGIACALQHLPLLKSFYPLPFSPIYYSSACNIPDVFKGILTLQIAAIHKGKEQVTLRLSVLYFGIDLNPRELRDVLMSCPNLETIEVRFYKVNPRIFTLGSFKNLKELRLISPTNEILGSTGFKQLLSAKGKEIEAITLELGRFLDLVLINDILHSCINLKRLSLDRIHIDVTSYNAITSMPSCIGKIENIYFDVLRLVPPFLPYHGYFCDLLSNAKSLKRLTLASSFAEQVFLNALDNTSFQYLQDFVVIYNQAGEFPFQRLLDARNSLRNIFFWDHKRKKSPVIALWKQFVRKNNYEVEFFEIW